VPGKTRHGTTGIAPIVLFEEEKETLKSLPAERFEVPVWKPVIVSSDRFFEFKGRYYAMPYQYRGLTLNVRNTKDVVRVFDARYSLLREYLASGKLYTWLSGDFPEDKEALMQGEYPRWLLSKARSYGPTTEKLIESVLSPHAYLNAR
jgi:hypothetical protein